MAFEINTPSVFEVEVKGAKFKGAPLDASAVNKLVQKHTTKGFRRGVPSSDFDQVGFGKAHFKAVVKSWEDMELDGEPAPCTPENMDLLYEKAPGVVGEILEAFEAAAEAAHEVERKN